MKIKQPEIIHSKYQQIIPQGMYPPQNYSQYPYNPALYPFLMNNNNKNDSINELLKIFLLQKLFADDKPQIIQNPQMPQVFQLPYPKCPKCPKCHKFNINLKLYLNNKFQFPNQLLFNPHLKIWHHLILLFKKIIHLLHK